MSAQKKAMLLSDIFAAMRDRLDGEDAAAKQMDKDLGEEWRIFIIPDRDTKGHEAPGTKYAKNKTIDPKGADDFFTRVQGYLETNPIAGRGAADSTELDAAAELPQVKITDKSSGHNPANPVSCILRQLADMMDAKSN